MAYQSSTVASSLTNPPTCIIPKVMGGLPATTSLTTGSAVTNKYQEQGGAVWLYKSSHASTIYLASNFFTDAKAIGMRPGDIVMAQTWTTEGSSVRLLIASVVSVSTAGAGLSTSQVIASS